MGNVVLTEYYPRQQTLTAAGKQFANRLNDFFGGGWQIERHEVLSSSDWNQKECMELSNGRQLLVELTRSEETFELTASAVYAYNPDYLQTITDQDREYLSELIANTDGDIRNLKGYEMADYLYQLASERLVQLSVIPGVSEPLTEAESKEESLLSFLVPKLMIVTGRARENNFHLAEVTE
ncbi:hypothetical protein [Enterococcus sp. 5H]|uniref:hypothetical protein n=1 Tax=Enterococcus sp. 5H TaxID=1229490 RepID=UPI0023038F03|nr:hypothetical protein [Enterococcus sp. 5H]MDA9470779.1 hypothetical protein [Enterococcus sp. 5H]